MVFKKKCQICNKSVINLNRHFKSHKINTYSCDICKKKYLNFKACEYHKKINHIVYNCSICKSSFRNKILFIKHSNLHFSKYLYKCELCNIFFLYKNNINAHYKKYHDFYFKCLKCNITFKSYKQLNQHLHDKINKCNICYKKCKNNHGLKRHNIIHRTKCEKCNIDFNNNYLLRSHLKKNLCKNISNEKNYCHICNLKLTSIKNLEFHLITHFNNIEKLINKKKNNILICNFCNKTFLNSFDYDLHKITHF